MPGLELARISIFHVFHWSGIVLGVAAGVTLGLHWFDTIGVVIGGILGLIVGSLVGSLPDWIATKSAFKEFEENSIDELKEILKRDEWNFYQTMALLNLAARDEDVQGYLPCISRMLQSDKSLDRVYGWDALRLVFPLETKLIGDYDPKEPTKLCRVKVGRLDVSDEGDDESTDES